MHMSKLLSILALFLILIFSGCKKSDTPTEPTTENASNPTGQPMPSFSDQQDLGGVMATINYSMASPIPGLPSVSTSLAFATFGNGIDAGSINVNSNSVGALSQQGKTYYLAPNPSSPLTQVSLNWNGTNHTWNVAGGNGIPAISGSVKSPIDFTLSSPASSSSITKSGGIQAKWTNASSSRVLIQLVSISNSALVKVYQDQPDNGSFTIPSSDLSSFNGDCLLFIVKYNYNIVTVSGKKYVLVSEIVKNIAIKLG